MIGLKILAGLAILIISLLLLGKWSGKMTFRKSNERLLQEIGQGDVNVGFHTLGETSDFTLEYARVKYKSLADTADQAILFVHGSPGSLDAYQTFLKDERIQKAGVLYAYDRQGFGGSSFGVAEPSLSRQAAFLARLIDEIEESRVLLVGHSFGSAVVAKLAMEYPEKVDGIFSIAGTLQYEAEPRNWWRVILDFTIFRLIMPTTFRTCNEEMLPLRMELRDMITDWQKITCPVRILHGTSDWIVSYQNLPLTVKRLGDHPNLEAVTLKGGGHLILWTMHERMVEEILLFVGQVNGINK